jgi:hypothetical protein
MPTDSSLKAFAASLGGAPLEDAIQIALDRDLRISVFGDDRPLTEAEANAADPNLLVVTEPGAWRHDVTHA